jgi:hypothetical protein
LHPKVYIMQRITLQSHLSSIGGSKNNNNNAISLTPQTSTTTGLNVSAPTTTGSSTITHHQRRRTKGPGKSSTPTTRRKLVPRSIVVSEYLAGCLLVWFLVLQTFHVWHVHDHLPISHAETILSATSTSTDGIPESRVFRNAQELLHHRWLQCTSLNSNSTTTAAAAVRPRTLLEDIRDYRPPSSVSISTTTKDSPAAAMDTANSSTLAPDRHAPNPVRQALETFRRRPQQSTVCSAPPVDAQAHMDTTVAVLAVLPLERMSASQIRTLTVNVLQWMQWPVRHSSNNNNNNRGIRLEVWILMTPSTYTQLVTDAPTYASRLHAWSKPAHLLRGSSSLHTLATVHWVTHTPSLLQAVAHVDAQSQATSVVWMLGHVPWTGRWHTWDVAWELWKGEAATVYAAEGSMLVVPSNNNDTRTACQATQWHAQSYPVTTAAMLLQSNNSNAPIYFQRILNDDVQQGKLDPLGLPSQRYLLDLSSVWHHRKYLCFLHHTMFMSLLQKQQQQQQQQSWLETHWSMAAWLQLVVEASSNIDGSSGRVPIKRLPPAQPRRFTQAKAFHSNNRNDSIYNTSTLKDFLDPSQWTTTQQRIWSYWGGLPPS